MNERPEHTINLRHSQEYEKLRAELLDLSRKNPMLNYKHRPGSRQQLRIVDTTLDFALSELAKKQRKPTISPLPDPEDIPVDECTTEFLAALGHAKASDLEYLMRLESLNSVARQEEAELYELDTWLRQRVRAQLGLSPRLNQKEIKLVDHARALGVDPSYSLTDRVQNPTRLSHLQTMYLADDLDPRLNRISADTRLSEQETGLSTLFLAFGFLRWFDGSTTDIPNFAPLLLLPVQIKKEIIQRRTTYFLQATSEEPEINLSLRELLLRRPPDVTRTLPEFDIEIDSAGSYFTKVQQSIEGLKDWRIEPYMTLGHFSFGRLAMFSDLDSKSWDIHPVQTAIVGTLMSGNDGGPVNYDHLMFSPNHDIDNDIVEDIAPLLLSEADGSQHSAIIDVMSGKNLVIEGPPGTGKSQTITNIVANALFSGRTVLFLSEKQAALEVVKKRLEAAGIGDFCLELHSHKAHRRETINSLRNRCEISTETRNSNAWRDDLEQLRSVRNRMTEYLGALHARNSEGEESAFELFWSAIARRRGLEREIHIIRRVDAEPILKLDRRTTHDLRDSLENYTSARNSFQARFGPYATSPWHSLALNVSEGADSDILRSALENLHDSTKKLLIDVKDANETLGIDIPKQATELKHWLAAIPELPIDVDCPLLLQLSLHKPDEVRHFAQLIRSRLLAFDGISPNLAGCDASSLDAVCSDAERLKVTELTPTEIADLASRLIGSQQRVSEAMDEFTRLANALHPNGDVTTKTSVEIARMVKLSNEIPPDLYEYLAFDGGARVSTLEVGLRLNSNLAKDRAKLEHEFSLDEDHWPPVQQVDACIAECSAGWAARWIGAINGRRQRSAQILKTLNRNHSSPGLVAELKNLREYLVSAKEFLDNTTVAQACGAYWRGQETKFDKLLAVVAIHNDFLDLAKDIGDVGSLLKSRLFSTNSKIIPALKTFSQHAETIIEAQSDWSTEIGNLRIDQAKPAIHQRIQALEALSRTTRLSGLAGYARPVSQLFEESQKLKQLSTIDKQLLENPISKSISVEIVLNERGHTDLDRAAAIFQTMQRLGISAELKKRLTSAEGSEFSVSLSRTADSLRATLLSFSAKMEHWAHASNNCLQRLANRPEDLVEILQPLALEADSLSQWTQVARRRSHLCDIGLEPFLTTCESEAISDEKIPLVFDAWIANNRGLKMRRAHKSLSESSGASIDQTRQRFRHIDANLRLKQRDALRSALLQRSVPTGSATGPRKTWTEIQCLRDEFMRQNHASIRDLMTRSGRAIQALKPCFMMSPLSLAKYLPPGSIEFDLLVIDEASQMRPEDALGGLLRAKQVVVVGDPQQLPPSDFFSRVASNDDSSIDGDGDDIDAESILDWCLKTYTGPRRLKWHYRSKCESLIGFSNREFYRGDLITFPNSKPNAFSIDLVRVQGNYKKGRNPTEAAAIVSAAINFMKSQSNVPSEEIQTLGIVAINSEQRELILEEFNRSSNDEDIQKYLAACETQTKTRGTEEFFIKNLENVQGDERDHIMISLTYGPESGQETMAQRFGPINRSQGHRRLNVLFTRARQRVTVFSSMTSQHIVAENARRGVRVLHEYLRYIENQKLEVGSLSGREFDSDFEREVFTRLEQRGFSVDPQVGVGGYRIDLGVRDSRNKSIYLAGIECDGASFHSAKSSRDRDKIRESVLRSLGWKLLRVWSTDWFADPDGQTEILVSQLNSLAIQTAQVTD